jgi:Peptidase family M23
MNICVLQLRERFCELIVLSAVVLPGIVSAAEIDLRNVPSTALMIKQLSPAYFIDGDDGNRHIEYDLLVTSVFSGPVTLKFVDVTDENGKTLMRLDGDRLVEATQTLLDQKPVKSIPASSAVAVEIDLTLPGKTTVPARLSHRIAYDFSMTEPLATAIGKKQVDGPIVSVNQTPPIVIASPLAGTGWLALNGCCSPNVHRNTRVGASDRIATSETFAIDWMRVDEGKECKNDCTRNDDYSCFGVPVRSVSNGEVIGVRNDMPDESPSLKQSANIKTPFDYAGNFVYVRIRPDLYAFYGHLQPGTVTVRPGDKVKTGTVLGKLGNSGNSTAPHLHFGLLDRPDAIAGNSRSFVIDKLTITGTLKAGEELGHLRIESKTVAVKDAYPLVLEIVTYH